MLEERIIHLEWTDGRGRTEWREGSVRRRHVYIRVSEVGEEGGTRHAFVRSVVRPAGRPAESFCRQKALIQGSPRVDVGQDPEERRVTQALIAKAAAHPLASAVRDDTFQFFAIAMNVDRIQ